MAASSSTLPPVPGPRPITLTRPLMESFKPAKALQGTQEPGHIVTSMSFDPAGDVFVTCGTDHAFQVVSCKSGKVTKSFNSKKYGCDLIRCLRSKNGILFASTMGNDDIRHMTTHNNVFLNYFSGHTGRVLSIHVNPTDDTFISSAMDGTVRLWDIRQKKCLGVLEAGREPVAAFDNTGKVFAVVHNNDRRDAIHLFDSKNYEGGSFDSIALIDPRLQGSTKALPLLTSLSFAPDGRNMLIGTADSVHYVIDAFDGHLVRRLIGFRGLGKVDENGKLSIKPQNRNGSGQEICWSPDGRYVIAGGASGHVFVWDVVETPLQGAQPPVRRDGPDWYEIEPILKREASNGKAVRAVAFNPRNALFAAGTDSLSMWMPERDKLEEAQAKS